MNIAVLLTCFNRKEKTLQALDKLTQAYNTVAEKVSVKIYLTDDGSTDGTGDAVKEKFPNAVILKGNGNLFWAGGMRNSWNKAINSDNYDGYLLLNDDTNVYEDVFDQLMMSNQHSIKKYGKGGIYIGSTRDSENGLLTYGGAKLTHKFWFKYNFLEPNGNFQECELGNANIMFVAADVIKQIGILSKGYIHGVADYDYTLKAVNKNIPVFITPNYCGNCKNDHKEIYTDFSTKKLKERIELLKSPLGLDIKSNLNLMKRHFPFRVPFVILSALLKVILPRVYVKNFRSR